MKKFTKDDIRIVYKEEEELLIIDYGYKQTLIRNKVYIELLLDYYKGRDLRENFI